MNVNVRAIIEDGLIEELQHIIRNVPVDLITAGQIGRFCNDLNRFRMGSIPLINQLRNTYKKSDKESEFDASYEVFLDSTESFDRPIMTITGYMEYEKDIFDGIIVFN